MTSSSLKVSDGLIVQPVLQELRHGPRTSGPSGTCRNLPVTYPRPVPKPENHHMPLFPGGKNKSNKCKRRTWQHQTCRPGTAQVQQHLPKCRLSLANFARNVTKFGSVAPCSKEERAFRKLARCLRRGPGNRSNPPGCSLGPGGFFEPTDWRKQKRSRFVCRT